VHDCLKKEILALHRQNKEMFDALCEREHDITLLNEKVRNRETTITEL